MHLQIALSGAIPALVAMWVVDRMDAKRPEPPQLRRAVVFFGMLSVVPALLVEGWLGNDVGAHVAPKITYQGSAFHAFVVAAAVEEACKISVIYWVVWRRPEFDERMDGIVYGSRAGLGFALVENVMYLLAEGSFGGQVETWIMRAVLAVPGHAIWSGIIGALAARRRFDGKGTGLVGGYLLAVACHGAYDLTAFVQTPLHLEGHDVLAKLAIPTLGLLIISGALVLRSLARDALRLDDADVAHAAAAAAARAAAIVP